MSSSQQKAAVTGFLEQEFGRVGSAAERGHYPSVLRGQRWGRSTLRPHLDSPLGGAPLVRLAIHKASWQSPEDIDEYMDADILVAFDDGVAVGVDIITLHMEVLQSYHSRVMASPWETYMLL